MGEVPGRDDGIDNDERDRGSTTGAILLQERVNRGKRNASN